MEKNDLIQQALQTAQILIDGKKRLLRREIRRRVDHKLYQKLLDEVEQQLQKALVPLFQKQVASIVSRLVAKSKEASDLAEKHLPGQHDHAHGGGDSSEGEEEKQ